jgi:hypothetical protein
MATFVETAVLTERGRQVLHIHLGADVSGGLVVLRSLVRAALVQEDTR